MEPLVKLRHIASQSTGVISILFRNYYITALFPVVCAAVVHSQVVHMFFKTDDFIHLFQIANDSLLNFLFDRFQGHLYIFRNLVFYLMYQIFGMQAVYYFWSVFIMHLACVYMLYKLIIIMTDSPMVASIGAAIWGICPVNHATLSWYSAFGVVLMTFFLACIFYETIKIKKGLAQPTFFVLLRLNLFIAIVGSSYGIGLGLVLLMPLIFWFLLKGSGERGRLIVATTPAIIITLFLAFSGFQLSSISGFSENYSVAVNIHNYLTNTQNLFYTIGWFLGFIGYSFYCLAAFPLLFLIQNTNQGALSITNDYANLIIVESISVIVFLLCFGRAWLKGSRSNGSYYQALLLCIVAMYATVAVSRTQSFLNIGYFSPGVTAIARYHYAGLLMMAAFICLMITDLSAAYKKKRPIKIPIFLLAVILISVYPARHNAWRFDPGNVNKIDRVFNGQAARSLYGSTVHEIEAEARTHPPNSTVFLPNEMKGRFIFVLYKKKDFPNRAAVYTITYPDEFLMGRRIRFVEKDEELIKDYRSTRKSWPVTKMLVTPGEAGAAKIGIKPSQQGDPHFRKESRSVSKTAK